MSDFDILKRVFLFQGFSTTKGEFKADPGDQEELRPLDLGKLTRKTGASGAVPVHSWIEQGECDCHEPVGA